MSPADQSPWKYVVLWLRIVFGAHLAYSGLAFVAAAWTPADMVVVKPGVGTFMVALEQIGLYQVVKSLEVVTGIMLLLDIATPLALVLEFPITIVIVYLCLVVNPVDRQLYTGPQELLLNVALLFAYGGYYAPFFRIRARPLWLWDGFGAQPVGRVDTSRPLGGAVREGAATEGRIAFALAVTVALSVLALVASALLSEAGRRLVPRDYVPFICGFAVMALAIVRGRARAG
jgi:putative oxidoreductase